MSDADSTAWIVREGQEVLGSDGKKVGEVTGSAGSALVVKHGFLFAARDVYVPVSAIAAIDAQSVHLNVTADVATNDEWGRPPAGASVVPNVTADASSQEGVTASTPASSSPSDTWTITEGMAVIGADGEQIGEVEDGSEEAILVRVGRFFSRTVSIDASQISDVRQDAVHVTTTKREIEAGTETSLSSDLASGAAGSTAIAGSASPVAADATSHSGDLATAASGLSASGSEGTVNAPDVESSTPLADLQGRITNAWGGTKDEIDAEIPAVDFGKPDPDFPISPPSGETPYAPPSETTTSASDDTASPDLGAASVAGDAFRIDAPDESIDTPSVAAEVPGLDLTDAGIPAENKGNTEAVNADFTFDASTQQPDTDAISALSDAGAIGESPDPDLAAEAQTLDATESFRNADYTDLPSDPFIDDVVAVRPEDDLEGAIGSIDYDTGKGLLEDSASLVELPGDFEFEADDVPDAPEFASSVGNDLKSAATAADADTTPLRSDSTFTGAPLRTPAAGAASEGVDFATSQTGSTLPPADSGTSSQTPSGNSGESNGGFLGQLRQRISEFFDKPGSAAADATTAHDATSGTSTLAGATGTAAAATERVRSASADAPAEFAATIPDVEVDATIPDAPARSAFESADFLARDEQDTPFAPQRAPDARTSEAKEDEPGIFQGVKDRVESFLDAPTDPSTRDVASADDARFRVESEDDASALTDDASSLTDDAVSAREDVSSTDADALEAEAYAQELYVSDPDIDGFVRTVTPATDDEWSVTNEDELASTDDESPADARDGAHHLADLGSGESEVVPQAPLQASFDDRRALESDAEDSVEDQGEESEGFFEEIRTKVEHFLDNPEVAETPESNAVERAGHTDETETAWEPVTPSSAPDSLSASTSELDQSAAISKDDLDSASKSGESETADDAAAASWRTEPASASSYADTASSTDSEHPTLSDDASTVAESDTGSEAESATSGDKSSRYAVVGNHDDDDDLYDSLSLLDDSSDATLDTPETEGAASAEVFASDVTIEGASPRFEALSGDAAIDGGIDVEVNESASELLESQDVSDAADSEAIDGEQAETDVFASLVDATDDTDIDDFGTPEAHRASASTSSDLTQDSDDSTRSGDTFSPTPDAELLADVPSANDAASDLGSTAFTGDETIAKNAASGSLADADDAASAWTAGESESTGTQAAGFKPTPLTGDTTIAENAASGTLQGASDSASDATRQDRTIAENARTGKLAGAGDVARSWTSGEADTTRDNAKSTIDGDRVKIPGAKPLAEGAESRAASASTTESASQSTSAALRGPAETEGVDWIAATPGEDAPAGWPIKGNADSGIYHVPEASSYERTKPEVWFRDTAAAERAGYRAPRSGNRAGDQAAPSTKGAAAAALADVSGHDTAGDTEESSGSKGSKSSEETVAGNATSGELSDSNSAATSWTQGERSSTSLSGNDNAIRATPLSASGAQDEASFADTRASEGASTSPSNSDGSANSTDEDTAAANRSASSKSGPATDTSSSEANRSADRSSDHAARPSRRHGPAETEGVDWIAATPGEGAPAGWPIKGNADSGIYHVPEATSYEKTKPEVWFPNAEAAERAGYRAPRAPRQAGEHAASSTKSGATAAVSGTTSGSSANSGTTDSRSTSGGSTSRSSTGGGTSTDDASRTASAGSARSQDDTATGITGSGTPFSAESHSTAGSAGTGTTSHQGADDSAASGGTQSASSVQEGRVAKGHGPAETEGTDWIAAVDGEDTPNGWLVKGNADSGIYHTLESSSYERTVAEVWFPDADAAERSGFRAPRSARHAGESATDSADAAAKKAKDRLDTDGNA